jgi:5,10-methylenetetrahydrofolate reductase
MADSKIQHKIKNNDFVILAEFEPPKGADFSPMLKSANLIKGRVDAIVVPEMANAVMKASSLGGCLFLQNHGFETVFQVCCRDRNRLALQADILSASALGVPNIMAVPGEDIRYGDHPKAREVYDLELLDLIEAIQVLQSGKDLAGIELNGTPSFFVGSIVNAGVMGGALDIEIENVEKMLEKGVEFVITTPIFDLHRFSQFLKKIAHLSIAIIPTVLLLKSAGMARYIDRNIKHISIPEEMIRSIQKAADKKKRCVEIAAELISELKEMGMSGVMISTIGWEDKLPMILDSAKL